MIVTKENFLTSLESVQGGLSPKQTTEQSDCYIFLNGEVITYNEEVCCRCPSGLDSTIKGAVRSKELLEIIKKIKDEELQASQEENSIIFYGKNWEYSACMEEVLFDYSLIETPEEWSELHEDFCEALALVYSCTSKEFDQLILTCVNVHPKWVEACDNRQMCRWKLPTSVKEPVLISRKGIKNLANLGIKEISETPGWIHFRGVTELVISTRRILEDYPSLGGFLRASEGVPLELPKGLMDMADTASVLASSDDQSDNNIQVNLSSNKIRIKSQSAAGSFSTRRKIKYEGDPIEFFITPKIFIDLVKNHTNCLISQDTLKIDGGAYTYVARLRSTLEEEKEIEDE